MTRRVWSAVAVLSTAVACGGSGTRPSAPLVHVAGQYDIQKLVVEDTCDTMLAGQTFTNPATVRHTAGATAFVLNDHGTRDLPGTVRPDGSFTLDPARAIVHGSIPALDTFDNGRFTSTGFGVRNTTALDATPISAACNVVAEWTATKQGAPNVIP